VLIKYRKGVSSFNWLILNHGKKLPYTVNDDVGMGSGLLYSPHPFTNWSLNPSYVNRSGEHIHTREGFKKTMDSDSIMKMIKENPDANRIVCIGGSTTYCSLVERYQDSWPALLRGKLKKKSVIFNFGVGGWSTSQSLIRCLFWLHIVKPNLFIFYQAKNDFMPLFWGSEKENTIDPDCQNVMGQFSECYKLTFPKPFYLIPLFYMFDLRRFMIHNEGFVCLFKRPESYGKIEGFSRVTEGFIESVVFRAEALFSICRAINCQVIYVPEVMINTESDNIAAAYSKQLGKVYDRVREIALKYDNVEFFEVKGLLPETKDVFFDNLHLNEKGCSLFSDILANHINKSFDDNK
jgi:hypothetical protein